MTTEFSKEQQLFREVVARFLKDVSPTEAVRDQMASDRGYDPDVWKRLCDEAELAGTHIPEPYGGSGLGQVELGIVTEEMGRVLYCGPFFASSVMASTALLLAAEDGHKQALLPGIANGTTIATLVLDDLDEPGRLGRALREADGTLSGTAPLVVDAHVADVLIAVASDGNSLGLYSVAPSGEGIQVSPVESLDATRKLSRVAFDGAAAQKLGQVDERTLGRIWDHLCVALAHEMIGGAQQMLESTVAYTKERVQFGRPIGSFQALKHRCADLLMEVQLARALTHHAARCLDTGEGEPYAASMAKAAASDAYMEAVRTGIQLRGGIGFTWEDDTHLWFKRAKSSEVFLGAPHRHRERMMTLLEATA